MHFLLQINIFFFITPESLCVCWSFTQTLLLASKANRILSRIYELFFWVLAKVASQRKEYFWMISKLFLFYNFHWFFFSDHVLTSLAQDIFKVIATTPGSSDSLESRLVPTLGLFKNLYHYDNNSILYLVLKLWYVFWRVISSHSLII